MPNMTDIGPYIFAQAAAASTVGYGPPFDREAVLTRVLIDNVSANDTWTVTVGGREIMRFYLLTAGNQQLTGILSSSAAAGRDLFTWYRVCFNDDLIIPIPRGLQCVVSSIGGATANITLMGVDVTVGTVQAAMVNHYQGNRFLMPQYGYLNAAVTATGETAFDSAVRPAWVGSIFTGVAFPVGWRARIIALFVEAASVNTFSGSANHVSSTDHVGIVINGERLLTHVLPGAVSGQASGVTVVPTGQFVAPEGLPNLTPAAAAGSANTVYSKGSNPLPAFQVYAAHTQNVLDTPLVIHGGDNVQFYHGITGDITGNPSYATVLVLALLEVLKVG